MRLECWLGKWLGEDVGNHLVSLEEVNLNLSSLDDLSYPVHLDVNVLHAAMMLWVSKDP